MPRSIIPLSFVSCGCPWSRFLGSWCVPTIWQASLPFLFCFILLFVLANFKCGRNCKHHSCVLPTPHFKRLVFQLKACWISLISLTQISLISLTLDGPTENCLILLLQCVSAAAGKPAFFLWASWQKCKQFKDCVANYCFISRRSWDIAVLSWGGLICSRWLFSWLSVLHRRWGTLGHTGTHCLVHCTT